MAFKIDLCGFKAVRLPKTRQDHDTNASILQRILEYVCCIQQSCRYVPKTVVANPADEATDVPLGITEEQYTNIDDTFSQIRVTVIDSDTVAHRSIEGIDYTIITPGILQFVTPFTGLETVVIDMTLCEDHCETEISNC